MYSSNQKEDLRLLEKVRQGEEDSFNELYKKYWKTVYNSAYKRLLDKGQAENITQDIFIKLWLKRDTLSIQNLSLYLHVAVRNSVFNLFEKERRVVSVENLIKKEFTSEEADKKLLQNEFLSAYKALVESLPGKRKTIFLEYYNEGKTTAEIAEQLSISRKTVQNQLGRAVTFLKSELTQLLILAIILWL